MQRWRIPRLNQVFVSGIIINRLYRRRGRGSDRKETGERGRRVWRTRERDLMHRTQAKHATFTCSLCIANHAYVMRPSSFMQIVWVRQRRLIHIHVAGGAWHLSAGRWATLNLLVNAEHMRGGRVDYAHAHDSHFQGMWLAVKKLLSELASDSVFTVCVHI